MDGIKNRLGFFDQIEVLRRDDRRLYHQSRINQTLHLISACCFLLVYGLIWFKPAQASILAWFGAMWMRQTGHFFFEPRGFDKVHNLSNATKESIKVGFNVYRKIALLAAWAAIPVVLWADSTVLGMMTPAASRAVLVNRIGWGWLFLAGVGLFGRTLWLMVRRDFQTGAAWFTKILTDPFHNVREYWRSPLFLLKGELIEPLDQLDYSAVAKP
jgi:hypothetical protein